MFTAPAAMRSTGETFTFLPMLSALAVMNALARDWCEHPVVEPSMYRRISCANTAMGCGLPVDLWRTISVNLR